MKNVVSLFIFLLSMMMAITSAYAKNKPPDIRKIRTDIRTIKAKIIVVRRPAQNKLTKQVTKLEKSLKSLKAKQTKNEIRVELSSDILFDFDKSELKPKAKDTLRKVTHIITEKRRGKVKISGHTDSKGDEAYNMKLSVLRAEAVKDWLSQEGDISPRHFYVKGYGEKDPVADNQKADGSDNPDGRAQNRRVEIIIETKESEQ